MEQIEKIEQGDKVYMVHEAKHKFWEIRNLDKINFIRYGKWHKSEESKIMEGQRNYFSVNSALDRALELIIQKSDKGYLIYKKEKCKGPVFNTFASLINRTVYGIDDEEVEIELN
ncbi:hypothetical protein SteCoe_20703 [Stentor coeruleus]|uniref:Uncharacterized protein n=1 Tax=Stentor coeruleus TaxID=5963 RepID=A0A1R2BRF0_9CILI|nr:hypothetical protein SteCoe_20703 [Stentor coeruleus]